MRATFRYCLVVSLAAVVLLGSGCASYYVREQLPSLDWEVLEPVENRQPLSFYFRYTVHGKKGQQINPYLTGMWGRQFIRAMEESGLFSSVDSVGLFDSRRSGHRLDLVLSERFDVMKTGGEALVTGFTLTLVKSTQTADLQLSARYTNPGRPLKVGIETSLPPGLESLPLENIAAMVSLLESDQREFAARHGRNLWLDMITCCHEAIASEGNNHNHILHQTLGLIGSTPDGIKKSSGDEASFQVAKDLTIHLLRDLQRKGQLK